MNRVLRILNYTVCDVYVTRAAILLLASLFVLATKARGAEFVVVNKTAPAFTVVNKVPAPAPQRLTTAGGAVIEFRDGAWHYAEATGAPGVAPTQTFRSGQYHGGHNCPSCSRSQYAIASHNRDGTHSHVCDACGTVWRH